MIHASRRLVLCGVFGAPQLPPDFRWWCVFVLCCEAFWAPHLPPVVFCFCLSLLGLLAFGGRPISFQTFGVCGFTLLGVIHVL